jgi:hypothetical protein
MWQAVDHVEAQHPKSEVESLLHVNMQIDRLVRCHMQVRIATYAGCSMDASQRWAILALLASYCTTVPCCSDDCSAFTICDLTCATISVRDLSTGLREVYHRFW